MQLLTGCIVMYHISSCQTCVQQYLLYLFINLMWSEVHVPIYVIGLSGNLLSHEVLSVFNDILLSLVTLLLSGRLRVATHRPVVS